MEPASDRITNIKEAIKAFEEGNLTLSEFKEKIEESGKGKVHFWNPITDPHPATTGNNHSRNHFKYDANNHPRGKIFQAIVKKSILAAINFAHNYWIKKYDAEAFVYDDPRLIALDKFLKEYITANMSQNGDCNNYKGDFMFKLVDILCGLCKEDIYYRARIFDLTNKFCGGMAFELTEAERENIEKWH